MRKSVVATSVLAVALLVGCSRVRNATNWTEGAVRSIGLRGEVVYFAAVDDLSVRDGPRLSARVVGHLELHQMVFRSGVDHGYARIRLCDGSLRGWVDDAKLVETLPSEGRVRKNPELRTAH